MKMAPKYYVLANKQPIRASSRSVWENWIKTTPADSRLLACSVIDSISIETHFTGVVSEYGGAYETSIVRPFQPSVAVRRYEGIDAATAIKGHTELVEEIRGRYENNK